MAFIDSLIGLRNGGVAIDMEEQLVRLIAAVRLTKKGGTLTLKLAVKPAIKGDDVDMVFVEDTISLNEPKLDKKPTRFFVDEKNNLTRNDTRQMDMYDGIKEADIREVR